MAADSYSLNDIESAMSYWLKREQVEGVTLGPNLRALADVFGVMVYERQTNISAANLTPAQQDAMTLALHQLPLI